MGRPLVQLPALVLLDGVAAIDVHGTVRIDGHHHLSDVAVDPPLLKPEDTQTFPFLRMLSTRTYGREMLLFVDDNLNQELLCVFMACRCFCVQAGKTTLPVFIHKWV